jgi:hypothetical protein
VTVTGRVGGSVGLLLQARRPGGGRLVSRRFSATAGRFRQTLRLPKDILPVDARLLPGGFVVSLRGSSAASGLPLQLRPILVPAPREGVVRTAFTSAVENGPSTARLPAGAKQAWVNFSLATQPSVSLPLSVVWYRPDRSILGRIDKSNRPVVTSFIKADVPIATGTWVAELRAGPKVVKRLDVRIG